LGERILEGLGRVPDALGEGCQLTIGSDSRMLCHLLNGDGNRVDFVVDGGGEIVKCGHDGSHPFRDERHCEIDYAVNCPRDEQCTLATRVGYVHVHNARLGEMGRKGQGRYLRFDFDSFLVRA
jgi:hypothetical protein